MKNRVTLKDVARRAGVSYQTVSKVLKNQIQVTPETRDRIQLAVEELDYRPDILARGLRSKRTYTIGFISEEIATTPYAVRMIQGAQDKAWELGYIILLINISGDTKMREAAFQAVHDRNVDGIVYATMYHHEVQHHDLLKKLPTVLLDCFVDDQSLPSVVPDEVTGGRVATEYLLSKGHQRIGVITTSESLPAKYGRLEGYRQALAKHNIPFDDQIIFNFPGSIPTGGYLGAKHILQQENRPTAIFCYNDRMAMGAYDAIRKMGLRIPDDVAIIGYDNQELIAADIFPGLTTMELPHYKMGQWAVGHLLEHIDTPQSEQTNSPVQKLLECPLIVRDSA